MHRKEGEKIMEMITSYEKKGIEKGIEKGKETVAEKMLLKGYDIETIIEITELSEEEIKRIKLKMKKDE